MLRLDTKWFTPWESAAKDLHQTRPQQIENQFIGKSAK